MNRERDKDDVAKYKKRVEAYNADAIRKLKEVEENVSSRAKSFPWWKLVIYAAGIGIILGAVMIGMCSKTGTVL